MDDKKLNQDKTDLVVISSTFHPMADIGHITVGSERIAPCDSVRNVGVQFDNIFSFEEHIKNICKSSFYHLRNIAKIRKYLTQDTCEILVHAFISSKLDHCNSLLHGLPKYLLARLHAVQNAAACVITLTPKFDHITLILINLHWLLILMSSITMKGSLLLFATSIVKLTSGYASFNVVKKAIAVAISFTAAKVSSTYLL